MFWHTGDILVPWVCWQNVIVDPCLFERKTASLFSEGYVCAGFDQRECAASVFAWDSQSVWRSNFCRSHCKERSNENTETYCSLTSPTWTALFSSFSSFSLFFIRIIEPLCLNEIALKECSTTLAFACFMLHLGYDTGLKMSGEGKVLNQLCCF